MIMSIDGEKAFDKIQNSFMIKTLSKQKIERNFLNMIKNKKPTANVILNNDKFEAFPQR